MHLAVLHLKAFNTESQTACISFLIIHQTILSSSLIITHPSNLSQFL